MRASAWRVAPAAPSGASVGGRAGSQGFAGGRGWPVVMARSWHTRGVGLPQDRRGGEWVSRRVGELVSEWVGGWGSRWSTACAERSGPPPPDPLRLRRRREGIPTPLVPHHDLGLVLGAIPERGPPEALGVWLRVLRVLACPGRGGEGCSRSAELPLCALSVVIVAG